MISVRESWKNAWAAVQRYPRYLRQWVVLVLLVTTVTGCAVANIVVKPWTKIHIDPARTLNPDIHGRASPVVLRVYELSAWQAFHNSDFFNLYDDAEQLLKGDLLSVKEIVVRPGQPYTHEMNLNPQTRYIGIAAAFRDIQDARWRLISDANPRGYEHINIAIDGITMRQSRN